LVGAKEKRAMEGINAHMRLVADCCRELARAYQLYTKGSAGDFQEEATRMRELEREADRARREVELTIYSGAFMPIYREDYLSLAELIDGVADDCLSAVNLLSLTRVRIPNEATDRIAALIGKTIQCVDALQHCVSICLQDRRKAAEVAAQVEGLEESIDQDEFDLRAALYKMPIDGYEKLLLNDLVERIGSISDTAEDVSDRIVIMVSKRG